VKLCKITPEYHTEAYSALVGAMEKSQMILLFTTTRCDWYVMDIRPAISKQCVVAYEAVNELYKWFSIVNGWD
jgi:hypothetical protein